jgi:hypothetical protein
MRVTVLGLFQCRTCQRMNIWGKRRDIRRPRIATVLSPHEDASHLPLLSLDLHRCGVGLGAVNVAGKSERRYFRRIYLFNFPKILECVQEQIKRQIGGIGYIE